MYEPGYELTPEYRAECWSKEIATAKKWMQRYHTAARKIEQSYLQQSMSDGADRETNADEYNVFWSNVQTINAVLFGRLPTVTVDRTQLDATDDEARVAASILERIFNVELKTVEQSPYYTFVDGIRDLNVVGLGVSWARYSFESMQQQMPPITDAMGVEIAPAYTKTVITEEQSPLDYVRWADFLMSPCRRWNEVRWVARRVQMDKKMLAQRFGDEIAEQVPLGSKATRFQGPDDPLRYTGESVADVWEIWYKDYKEAVWFVEGFEKTLDAMPDPLQLKEFFPVKCPLRATVSTHSFIPRPDYAYLKDQYAELNMVATRLRLLSEACRVVGCYDKTSPILERLVNQAAMNQLLPVDGWAMFAEKGGIKGSVDWMPLEQIVGAIDKLTQRKQALLQDIYEIYGINDVMRGTAKASETATAARLKTQFGSARLDVRQAVVAQWVTDNYRMRAEIICNHWQPETIFRRANVKGMPEADQKIAPAAIQLLKSRDPDIIARINVSAETMATPDWQAQQQQRVEFMGAVSQFIGMTGPMVEKFPGVAPYLVQMLNWAASGFKGAKQIEGILDAAAAALTQDMMKPKPPKPLSPQEQKDLASAQESSADAVKKLVEVGYPPQIAAQIVAQGPQFKRPMPPQMPGGPPQQTGGQPPMGPGGPSNVPPANIGMVPQPGYPPTSVPPTNTGQRM